MKKFKLTGCILLLNLSLSQVAFADSTITGQFLTVQNAPLVAQQDLLQQAVQVRFPLSVISIKDAMTYLLKESGYGLVAGDSFSESMLKNPLPLVDRNFGPITLEEGLTTLVGDNFQVLVDPVHRLISFRLKPTFTTLFNAGASS